jgi:hypothetical protein
LAQSIELGCILTPNIAHDRGIELLLHRESHSIKIMLYRVPGRRLPDWYIVTIGHLVSTMSSIERIGQYAFSHS